MANSKTVFSLVGQAGPRWIIPLKCRLAPIEKDTAAFIALHGYRFGGRRKKVILMKNLSPLPFLSARLMRCAIILAGCRSDSKPASNLAQRENQKREKHTVVKANNPFFLLHCFSSHEPAINPVCPQPFSASD